jgi:hexokinase
MGTNIVINNFINLLFNLLSMKGAKEFVQLFKLNTATIVESAQVCACCCQLVALTDNVTTSCFVGTNNNIYTVSYTFRSRVLDQLPNCIGGLLNVEFGF